MDLYLRKVRHPQTRDSYRVVIKDDGDEIEVGSIGIQHGVGTTSSWTWGVECVVPMRDTEARGHRQGFRRLHAAVSRGMGQV